MASGPGSPEFQELVAAAMRATGATNAAQLADALGLTGRNEYGTVKNWVNGTNAPSYDGTMRLLRAAGWLKDSPAPERTKLSPAQEKRRLRLLTEAETAMQRLREELG